MYMARKEVTKNLKVAERVLEVVMDAEAALDGCTPNPVMKAYTTCGNPERAVQTFEEVFGLAGDGSAREVARENGGRLAADRAAFNRFTVVPLLHAHAVRADYGAMIRVLVVVEGRDGAKGPGHTVLQHRPGGGSAARDRGQPDRGDGDLLGKPAPTAGAWWTRRG